MSSSSADNLWSKACRYLKEVLHPEVYSRWIEVIEPVALNGDDLILGVDNDFYQTWLEENYLPLIKKAISTARHSQVNIEFSIKRRQSNPEPEPKKKTIRDRFKRTRQAPSLNPRFTFESFIIGNSNNFAHAASLAVAQAPARAYNPLFIYGATGLGKTHLMQAIGHHVMGSSRASVSYLSSEAFTNEYISALQGNSLHQFRKKYRNTDLLLIDDIHFLAGKEHLQEEFFHTFNVLFDAHKQIVMTSDRPASEITGLEQRLVSRFEWGLVTELEEPDLETRIAILRNRQEDAQVELDDELIQFIAQSIRSNIRRLEGALVRALSYASLMGRDLSLESLEYLLRDMLEKEKCEEVSLESIQRRVAEHYDIRVSDMVGSRRPRAIAFPRQIAMYLCRRLTRSSLPAIATAFNRTHATILHACKSIDARMGVDQQLQRDVSSIAESLGRTIG